jgi:hypothetical protein
MIQSSPVSLLTLVITQDMSASFLNSGAIRNERHSESRRAREARVGFMELRVTGAASVGATDLLVCGPFDFL